MKFTWNAFFLAPLPVSALFGLAFAAMTTGGGQNPIYGFLFGFIGSGFIIVLSTLFLFLPALYLLTRFTAPNALKVRLLGAAIGLATYLPITRVVYGASGHDSGPPEGTYLEFLVGWGLNSLLLMLPAAGFITAMIYRYLGDRAKRVTVERQS